MLFQLTLSLFACRRCVSATILSHRTNIHGCFLLLFAYPLPNYIAYAQALTVIVHTKMNINI